MRIVYHLPNDDLVKARDTAQAAELALTVSSRLRTRMAPFRRFQLQRFRLKRSNSVRSRYCVSSQSYDYGAHAAWDLHKASLGRFHLGIGSQVRGHNERRYGVAWTAPAPRMRDYIGAVRALWDA